jgi:plasmid stabilization system protein ParE
MTVRYTPSSLAELDEILDYISPRSPQGALNVKARIQTIITMIGVHPFIGTATNHPGIRRVAASPYPYLVFYEIEGEDIIIRRIRHAARKPG